MRYDILKNHGFPMHFVYEGSSGVLSHSKCMGNQNVLLKLGRVAVEIQSYLQINIIFKLLGATVMFVHETIQ